MFSKVLKSGSLFSATVIQLLLLNGKFQSRAKHECKESKKAKSVTPNDGQSYE